MRTAHRKQRLTLLVLRDAQHSVKQIQLSKPLMIAVPAAALLSIAGLIVSLQIQSAQTISGLEQQLTLKSLEALKMEITVTDKNEAIERLNRAIIQLSGEAEQTKIQMERVQQLEVELQQFIEKHGQLSGQTSYSTEDDAHHVGGEFIAVHENEMLNLARETKDDFEEIQQIISRMEQHIPRTLVQAQETQDQREGMPSRWPTESKRLTSSFGYRSDPFTGRSAYHAGIDIAGKIGDPIYAAGAGVVTTAQRSGARGLYIIIKHPNGLETWYMHLNRLSVSEGERVEQGQTIGELGSSGRSTGPHLHFQVVKNDQTLDPISYLQ
ncbi:M23 family metallopeptidase [Paenibacillus sp. JCM 10914]|uniref:M23 family metallopeptidase n=1 Tax=Paenibacillus sp. JCM 10914 TaxID=1236974 RepID=UPI0003CC999E|nr:M23 family metallopeptidase [Paenibacillus sp. JCM 10914]GAE07336.1 peptidase, M23/M37 family [Paenibacillus sp. JCM 10914]